MSVKSLQELCYDSLAISMEYAPPLLQEMIMGETSAKMAKKLKKELKRDLTDVIREQLYEEVLVKVTRDLSTELPSIIISILRENLYNNSMPIESTLSDIDPLVFDCAIQVASTVAESMEKDYSQRQVYTRRYSNMSYEYDSDGASTMSDGEYVSDY